MLSYQVVNLMMPSTGDENYLPCFLHNFHRGLALVVARVNASVLKTRCSHIEGQVAMTVFQVILLPWGVEQPFLSPTYISWPAIGTEDVSMEWSPVAEIRDLRQCLKYLQWIHVCKNQMHRSQLLLWKLDPKLSSLFNLDCFKRPLYLHTTVLQCFISSVVLHQLILNLSYKFFNSSKSCDVNCWEYWKY